jgi:hypothetical protein
MFYQRALFARDRDATKLGGFPHPVFYEPCSSSCAFGSHAMERASRVGAVLAWRIFC